MGPKCFAKAGKPIPAVDVDLFGYDTAQAAQSASERVLVHIESLSVEAMLGIRHAAAAARRRLGVWS